MSLIATHRARLFFAPITRGRLISLDTQRTNGACHSRRGWCRGVRVDAPDRTTHRQRLGYFTGRIADATRPAFDVAAFPARPIADVYAAVPTAVTSRKASARARRWRFFRNVETLGRSGG